MKIESPAMNAGVGNSGVTNTDGSCRQRSFGDISDSTGRFLRQQANSMTDLDYIRSMEERYSIREEGLF